MSTISEITAKLKSALKASEIELYDFSEQHAGHSDLVPLSQNLHLKGKIKSPEFKGLSRIQKERLVYSIVGDEIKEGVIHALSLTLEDE
ncbi:MAG: BolA family protein [Bdellovibrionota bacterium]